ncbi:heterokaryon incompatibility protein [Colletotrichum tofieldiae]|nr:heterokaryon incompatibility protein [Colletotrichum tofieldiae]GKT74788.1 heterokaryon incompatibility protein [Colletotrichum tofieldiae]GKT91984.1 heterokaryon incompatibility protein [Colletotrichum tofieldiae]
MSDVYRSATLVIAAGSSNSSGDSFLDTGDRKEGATVRFAYQGRAGDIYCAPFPASGVHDDYRGIYGCYDPVFRRAWTLQECILPTRLVVFSSTELQWVCREHMVCEAGHQDSNKHHYSIYSIKEPTDAYHYWHNQVMEYTRRRMTLEKDKLPALAGVAIEISKIARDTYIGGVWEQNLIYDLCWERYLWEVEPFAPMSAYRAPTFSWASVGGNVFYNNDAIAGGPGISYPIHYTDGTQSIGHTKYYSTLLEAKTNPISEENPFGEITDGFIRIQGPLTEALIYDHKDTRPGRRYTHTARFIDTIEEFDFHCDIPLAQYTFPDVTDDSASTQDSTTALRASPGEETPVQGAKVWLLNIGYFPHRYNNPKECPYVWLGLLILGKSRKPGAFERIGYKNLMWPPGHSTWPHRELDKLRPFATGKSTVEITVI